MKKTDLFLISFCVLLSCFIFSCYKKNVEKEIESGEDNVAFVVSNNKDDTKLLVKEETIDSPVINTQNNDSFDTSFSEKNDMEILNEKRISEFCLIDENNRIFCLYHDVHLIENFDVNNNQLIVEQTYKNIHIKQFEQDSNHLKIVWVNYNDEHTTIVNLKTESPLYSTKRGIRVGDSVEKLLDAYSDDSQLFSYNTETKKYEKKSERKDFLFNLFQDETSITLEAGNIKEEEMMDLVFYCNEGIIEKIEISRGD